MASNWKLIGAIGILSTTLLGCRGSDLGSKNPGVTVHPVRGKVLLDGAPVEGALVVFSGGERSASGTTNAEGVFALTTFDPGDGALAGSYKVAITKREVVGADPSYADENSPNYGKEPPQSALGKQVSHIAEKFGNPESSGLTADVKPELEELTFEVTSK